MEYRRAGDREAGKQYVYDVMDRLTTIVRADGILQEGNVYDERGWLVQRRDGTGNEASIQYDFGGSDRCGRLPRDLYLRHGERLCRMRDRNGTEIIYTYNVYGNPLERRANASTADISELSERYEYMAESLLKSAISRSGTGKIYVSCRGSV